MGPQTDRESHPETAWESLPADPDPRRDLGYSCGDWDVVRTTSGRRTHLLFLPQDQQLLEQEAFVIASESTVVQAVEHR